MRLCGLQCGEGQGFVCFGVEEEGGGVGLRGVWVVIVCEGRGGGGKGGGGAGEGEVRLGGEFWSRLLVSRE